MVGAGISHCRYGLERVTAFKAIDSHNVLSIRGLIKLRVCNSLSYSHVHDMFLTLYPEALTIVDDHEGCLDSRYRSLGLHKLALNKYVMFGKMY
jgi:hypothetical protein